MSVIPLSGYDLLPFLNSAGQTTPACPPHILLIIIVSFYGWNYLYAMAKKVFGGDMKKAGRMVPLLHGFYATFVSSYVVYYDSPIHTAPESYCKPIRNCQVWLAISFAYFVWDFYICIKEKWSIDFLVHALFCIIVYSLAVFGQFMHRPAIISLFYEFSTIFLHTYIYAYYFGFTRIGSVLQKLFGIAFFFCRIVVGSIVSYEIWQAVIFGNINVEYGCIPWFPLYVIITVNALFHVLNVYWFLQIFSKAIGCKKTKRKRRRKHK